MIDPFADHVAAELERDELAAITYHDAETLDAALRARTFVARERLQLIMCDALTARDRGDLFLANERAAEAVRVARVWTGGSDVPSHARGTMTTEVGR